jgi:hypothetical protein
MNVLAFATPGHADWHWRIVDDDGTTVEESFTAFPTIAEAVAAGRQRLQRRVERDVPTVRRRWL